MKKLLIGCLSLFSTVFGCSREPIRCRLMDEIISDHAKNQKKHNNLVLIGSGGAAFDQVREFSVHFTAYDEKVSVGEARELFVRGVEELLDMINSNEKIRPYLYTYPFTENDLNYRLGFHDKNEKSVEPPYISYVFIAKGNVVYDKDNPVTDKFETVHKEPYQEALRIVAGASR